MGDVEIRGIRSTDRSGARRMLARAFDDDPPSRWLFPGARRRSLALRSVMGAAVADARPFGAVTVAVDVDQIVGLAAWLPPGAYPPGPARLARQTVTVAGIAPLFPSSVRKGSALLARMQAVHPKEEHWYLVILAVDPPRQGRGIGSALLVPGLEQADHDGLAAYLETAKERNLAFYGRHRFAVGEELRTGASPPMWTMRRDCL
jgi:GNAT superfamily N-acetyltransferase